MHKAWIGIIAVATALAATAVATPPAPDRLKPKQAYKFSWKEQGEQIVTASICAEYSQRTLAYRNCRSYALDYFQDKCHEHEVRYEQASGTAKGRQKALMNKFCTTYRRLP